MKPTAAMQNVGWRPVVWLGLVSLLTAIASESARAVGGPLLQSMGAGAAAVGVVAGSGELIGYTLRLAAGFAADRPGGAYRLLLAGTVLGIAAVALLSLAPGWGFAAVLLLCERVGRALRTPARDVMLASASERIGHGPGFGLHRLFDQAGGVVGPLVLAALVSVGVAYQPAFAILAVPAAGAIVLLIAGRSTGYAAHESPARAGRPPLPRTFWVLCATAGLMAAGTADFALIAFHFARTGAAGPASIPLLYAFAMAVEGVAAVALGFALKRVGASALLLTIAMSVTAAPMLFAGMAPPMIAVALWSIGMGGQYSLLRALVPAFVGPASRGAAFGWFNTAFGLCWFAGSAAMGVLYGRGPAALVPLAIVAQVAAVPLVFWLQFHREDRVIE
jgi:hypothetical protein